MVGSESVRLTLIALFAVLGAGYLAATVGILGCPGRGGQAIGTVLHVLMSAAMIAMVGVRELWIPPIALVTVFTAAAGWFGGQALFGVAGHHGSSGHHGDSVYQNWFHAGMMAAMVWMAVAMDLASPTPGGGMGGMSMPASMSGSGMSGTGTSGSAPAGIGSPAWAGPVSLALAAVFFAATAGQAIAALRPLAAPVGQRAGERAGRRTGPRAGPGDPGHSVADIVLRDGAGALMAAGMAIALLAMA
ncbi:MAG: DUF5134 domain-containing protein [Nocardiopsaceae bacterium]|nr:DUF5134 domain-containing protein [Nocardiopsaceae bacterium]